MYIKLINYICTQRKLRNRIMYYEEEQRNKLGYLEFTEIFYQNLDTLITTSITNVENDKEFYDEVVFKCFDLYQRESSHYSVSEILKFFHIFLYAKFKHKPSVEKDDNEITLY